MTIRAVEREAGLGNGTISKWETSSPSVKNLTAVAEVLGMKVEDLIRMDKEDRHGNI